jgi:hypothetical protein
MSKAFVDTTIVAEALLKTPEARARAVAALGRFDFTEVPTYALKEFAAGPLKNWIWCHNKLRTTSSLQKTMLAISRIVRTPRKYLPATALEALAAAVMSRSRHSLARTSKGSYDDVLADRFRYALRIDITNAWKRRRHITSAVTFPLPCYKEESPKEEEQTGLLILDPPCKKETNCTLRAYFTDRMTEIRKVREALESATDKPENTKRLKALKQIIKKPNAFIDATQCRCLGDAVFAILAPVDSVILTTNLKDHEALAASVGKAVQGISTD